MVHISSFMTSQFGLFSSAAECAYVIEDTSKEMDLKGHHVTTNGRGPGLSCADGLSYKQTRHDKKCNAMVGNFFAD